MLIYSIGSFNTAFFLPLLQNAFNWPLIAYFGAFFVSFLPHSQYSLKFSHSLPLLLELGGKNWNNLELL